VEEIQCAVTRKLDNISKTAFLEGMKKLKERANKCVDQGRIYYIYLINSITPSLRRLTSYFVPA
jgi:hypothetical protein